MGGYNSGRWGGRPTSEATASFIVDMHSLTLGGIRPGLLAKATIRFGDDEFPVNLTINTRGPGAGFIVFAHETRSVDCGPEQVSYRVALTTSRPNFGGRRFWFICPGSGVTAAKLYLPLGGRHFLSRRAYRLGYACQREQRSDRLMRKSRKLHRAIGGDGQALGQGAPVKPSGMHWRTYERRVAAWEAAEQRADNAWATSALMLLARHMA